MKPTAIQSNGNRPLLQLSGYAFRKLIVDSVQALDGVTYEVMFIAAQKEDNTDVFLPKTTYVPSRPDDDKYYTSQLVDLKPRSARTESDSDTTVTQMRLYGTGANAYVYIGTTEGIFRVSASRCEQYTDCCSCIAARDPYCAFDWNTGNCVAISDDNRMSISLIQDVITGNASMCASPPGTLSPATTRATESGGELGIWLPILLV